MTSVGESTKPIPSAKSLPPTNIIALINPFSKAESTLWPYIQSDGMTVQLRPIFFAHIPSLCIVKEYTGPPKGGD